MRGHVRSWTVCRSEEQVLGTLGVLYQARACACVRAWWGSCGSQGSEIRSGDTARCCYWCLVGGGQGRCLASHRAQDTPQQRTNYLVPLSISPRALPRYKGPHQLAQEPQAWCGIGEGQYPEVRRCTHSRVWFWSEDLRQSLS